MDWRYFYLKLVKWMLSTTLSENCHYLWTSAYPPHIASYIVPWGIDSIVKTTTRTCTRKIKLELILIIFHTSMFDYTFLIVDLDLTDQYPLAMLTFICSIYIVLCATFHLLLRPSFWSILNTWHFIFSFVLYCLNLLSLFNVNWFHTNQLDSCSHAIT